MENKISYSLLRELTIRNLKSSIETMSSALDKFMNEDWQYMDETLKKVERDIHVTRLILS